MVDFTRQNKRPLTDLSKLINPLLNNFINTLHSRHSSESFACRTLLIDHRQQVRIRSPSPDVSYCRQILIKKTKINFIVSASSSASTSSMKKHIDDPHRKYSPKYRKLHVCEALLKFNVSSRNHEHCWIESERGIC